MKTIIIFSIVAVLASCGKEKETLFIQDNSKLNEISDQVEKLKKSIKYLIESNNKNQDDIEFMQQRLAELETNKEVIEIYDPCPSISSKSGFKEVLFKLDNNSYVGYFENGNKRHLTVLEQGKTYVTTDDRACQFTL